MSLLQNCFIFFLMQTKDPVEGKDLKVIRKKGMIGGSANNKIKLTIFHKRDIYKFSWLVPPEPLAESSPQPFSVFHLALIALLFGCLYFPFSFLISSLCFKHFFLLEKTLH